MKTYADGIWRAISMLVDEKKLNRIDARIALRALRAEAEAAEPTPGDSFDKALVQATAAIEVIGTGAFREPTPAKPVEQAVCKGWCWQSMFTRDGYPRPCSEACRALGRPANPRTP